MRKLMIAATTIAALAVPAIATPIAMASAPVSPITVTPYHSSYTDSLWGAGVVLRPAHRHHR